MRNIESILQVTNLAEGNCVFISNIRHEYDFSNQELILILLKLIGGLY